MMLLEWSETKHNTVKNKHCKTPTETACRANFQMHEPHYLTLWHHLMRVSDIVTTFIDQKRQKSLIALL